MGGRYGWRYGAGAGYLTGLSVEGSSRTTPLTSIMLLYMHGLDGVLKYCMLSTVV